MHHSGQDEREQHSEEATRHYEEWAIDNGFEYIEIVAPHITKGAPSVYDAVM
jgi:hypothetical protein